MMAIPDATVSARRGDWSLCGLDVGLDLMESEIDPLEHRQ